jgi:serine/threonine protein kinase
MKRRACHKHERSSRFSKPPLVRAPCCRYARPIHVSESHRDLEQRLIGKLVGGKYLPEARIGTGGMGVVLRARDSLRDGPDVALKALLPELMAGEVGARFLRESELAKGILHPHVVPTLDSGHDAEHGIHYLVMPLMNGRDLAAALEELGALDPVAAVRIALQAARGINAAHRRGIIHRDVKPANLFLHQDAQGEVLVRVCDFGIAKQLGGGELTATGSNLGTPDYASPEQLQNAKHVDERTDVWSLGATLYEMLCGAAPFSHIESVFDLVSAILKDDVPHLQDRAPWLEPGLALAVHRALSRDPNQRQATLEEFADELRPYSEGDELLTPERISAVTPERRRQTLERADLSATSLAAEPPKSAESDELGLLDRKLSGKYRVIRLIGKGGMGAVYEVEAEDARRLAAKVVAGAQNAGASVLPRFAREAKAASAIVSPHVVATYDAGTDEELGFPYIIMELLTGVDLSSLLKREGALEPVVAARLVVQAARGVAAAHAVGVVHRDIKPANLFLHIDGESGAVTAKVCDFGVAKRTRTDLWGGASHLNLTRSGGMLGSPMYMSPEQAKNAKAVDERTDVWSLAVVLWEALSGKRLWGGQTSLGELIVAICTEPIPRIEAVAPWVPRDLARLVHRGLERDPAERPQTVHAFIGALEKFTDGSDRVTREQLQGLSEELQSELTSQVPADQKAARVKPAAKHAPQPQKRAERRAGGTGVLGLVAVALVSGGVAAGVAYYGMLSAITPESDSSAALLTVPPTTSAELVVEPADARVSIDGRALPVTNGRVPLAGKPGTRFRVVIEHGGRRKATEVELDESGNPEPRQVELN